MLMLSLSFPIYPFLYLKIRNLLMQERMMIFLHHIRIECQEAAALQAMEGLLSWVLFPIPGCTVKLIWRPKFTSLSKKHTVQFLEPLELKLMPLLGYFFCHASEANIPYICLIRSKLLLQ